MDSRTNWIGPVRSFFAGRRWLGVTRPFGPRADLTVLPDSSGEVVRRRGAPTAISSLASPDFSAGFSLSATARPSACLISVSQQGKRDLNPQPSVLETDALPVELLPSGGPAPLPLHPVEGTAGQGCRSTKRPSVVERC